MWYFFIAIMVIVTFILGAVIGFLVGAFWRD